MELFNKTNGFVQQNQWNRSTISMEWFHQNGNLRPVFHRVRLACSSILKGTSARKCEGKHEFFLFFFSFCSLIPVPLDKVLSLENAKKSMNSSCFSSHFARLFVPLSAKQIEKPTKQYEKNHRYCLSDGRMHATRGYGADDV